MPDHVHMQVQTFWFRRDVVFTVDELEQSIPKALEYGTSSSIQIQYPMIKDDGFVKSVFDITS